MNKTYRVVYNESTNTYTAVAEIATAKGKSSGAAVEISAANGEAVAQGAGLRRGVFAVSAIAAAMMLMSGNTYAATAVTGQTGDGITISTVGGTAASTVTADSIAIGRGAAVAGAEQRLGTQAIAIGENAQTRKEYTIAIGGNSDGGRQDGSVVIGNSAKGHTNSADNATRHTSYYNPFMPRNTWSANGQESSTHLLYSHKGEQQGAGVVSVGYKAEAEYGGVAVGDRAFAGDSATVNRPEYRGLGVAVGANAWSQDGGVVIGGGAVNERQNGIAIARQAVSKGRSAIAVGVSSVSVGDRSLAVGSSATSLGDNSIAIGASKTSNERYSATDNVQSEGRNSIAMGTQARVGNSFDTTVLTRSNSFGVAADNAELKAWNDRIAAETARVGVLTENSIAMGTEATVLAKDSMAVGTKSNTTGRNAIAIGKESVANNFGSIAIGEKAEAKTVAGNEGNQDGATGLTQTKAIAIGGEAKALHDKTVAVGDRATASGDHAFAMGAQALADKQYATAVGSNANATGEFATALGKSATASGNFGSAVGVDSKAIGTNSSAFGRLAQANGTSGLAMGHGAVAGVTSAVATDARNNAIAIGTEANSVGGHASIALGNKAKATQNNALAMGTSANVSVASGTAIGQNTNVHSIHAVALGTNATVDAGFDRSVALGAYSTVSAAVPTNTATVGGITYSGFAGNNPAVGDVVSVGNGDRKRQIQNVAAGRINATSTDAINGSQLYLTQVALDNAAQTAATNFGGGVTVGTDGKLTAPTYNLTNASGSPITDVNATSNNVGGALTNLNNYVNRGFDVTDNDGAVKGTVTPGEKVQFANGNATTSTVTAEANGITKVQYNVEVDGTTIKVENGKLTAVPAPAATPTKLENGNTTTVTNTGTDAAPVYKVEVNKADVAAAPTDTADADKITVNTDGKVVAPTDTAKAGNTFVTAQNLADVVNNSGFTLKTSATTDGTKDATSTADEVINPGETVEMVAGKNLTVKQEANGKVTYATKEDVVFNSVTSNTVTSNTVTVPTDAADPSNNPITISKDGISAGDKAITNVASGVNTEAPVANPAAPTAEEKKAIAEAVKSATGDTLTNAVNVGDLQAATNAAKTEVKGSGLATVAEPTVGENGQAIYTVDVAKAEAPTVARGSVTVKAGDENKVMTAGDVAKAITDSERTSSVTAGSKAVSVTAGTEDANGNTEYVVDVNTDKTITRDADGKLSVNTGNSLKVDADSGKIDVNTDDKTITVNEAGQVTAVTTNLTNSDKGAVNAPSAEDAGKLVTAQTVADAINKSGFTAKANGDAGELINPGDEVDFINGKNIEITRDGGKFTVATAKDVTFDSVTFGDNGPKITNKDGNINVAGNDGSPTKITGVANGTDDNDAVNVSQLKAAQAKVEATGLATVSSKSDANGTVYTVDVAKADAPTVARGSVTVTAGDENKVMTAGDVAKAITDSERTSSVTAGSKAVSVTAGTEDAKGNTEYVVDVNTDKTITRDADGKLSVNTGNSLKVDADSGKIDVNTDDKTITVNEAGQVTAVTTNLTNSDKGAVNAPSAEDAGKLVTAQTVADAINKSGFTAKANGDAGELINPGDEVEFINGKNIEITRDGGKFTVATAKDVTFDSVTFGDNGPKITNKDGNINVAGNDGSPTKITGVANGTDDNDAVNVSQLKAAQAKVEATGLATVSSKSDANGTVYTVDVAKADAPTVARGSVTVTAGDENKVMTAGDVAKAITDSERTSSVTAGSKAVSVTAGTEDAKGNTEYVVDVNTDKTITRDADGKLSVNTGNSLKVDADSGKIDVNTDDKTITLNEAGQVTAVTTNLTNSDKGAVNAPSAEDAGKLVTAQTVADAINKSGFTLKTSDVDGGEKVSGDDEVINPGETVEMVAGKNLTVKQEANGKVTYATKENVEFSTVKVNDATDPTKGGSVTVGGDEDGIQITSKPSSTAGEKPTNTIANLSNNLVDASKAAAQPSENTPANLGDKLNNAATVSDVLNAGWNLQGNGKAVDTVIHNDTVDFVNGKGTVVTVESKDGKNTIKVDSAIEFVNADAADQSTPSDTAKLTGAKPVQLGNVASGVRAEDGTALTGKDLAKAIENASGDQLTNAVNVGDLQAAAKAAKTEVKGSGLATVAAPTVGENGQAIYTVDVAKADAPTVTDGAVSVKAGDEGKVMVAGDVAKAINESGFKLTATASEGEVEGTSEELINPSDKVTVDAGKNIKLVQDAGKITVATKDDVVFNSVTSNTVTVPTDAANPSNNPITISKDGISAGNKAISNVASNLVDASKAAEQPSENSPANLGDKLNNAATVSDVLNAGWNLQGNGKAVDTVIHNDTVDFVNGKGTVVTVESKDGKNTIKVDSAIEFVNADANDASTPSDTAKLTGAKPVQLGNVASGVRAEDGTALTGKDLAKAIENASGDQLTNAVNVGDLQAAAKAAKTEVKGSGLATVAAPTVGDNGQAIYTVDVAKADAPTVTDGAVSVKAGDEGKVMVAGDVAKAINESGFKLTATASEGEVEGTSEELINPSDKVTVDAGKNIKLVQDAGKITVATKDDVVFNSVTSNTVTVPTDAANPSNNPITISKDGISAGNKAISNVASNLVDASKAAAQPSENSPANLGDKLNNAATVSDVLNAGWNLQGNGKAVDTVIHNDTVDFVNGKGTVVTVESKDGKNTIKVDSAIEFVNADANDASTPSDTAKLTGDKPVQLGNVASGVRKQAPVANPAAPTVAEQKAIAEAVKNASGDTLANAVNVGDLQAAAKAARTEVEAGKNMTVTERTGANGQAVYTVATKDDLAVTSVTAGNTTLNNNGVSIAAPNGNPQNTVSLSPIGLNNGGNTITNVAPGVNGTDAVNVNQLTALGNNLQQNIDNVGKKAYAGVAGAIAQGSIPQVTRPGTTGLGIGGGYYGGESAMAIGMSSMSDGGNWIIKGNVSTNTGGHVGVGFGGLYQW